MICPHCGQNDGIRRFISQYTHVDGTQWAGPQYIADSLEAAQAAAMEFPIQPLVIVGELFKETCTDDGGVTMVGIPVPPDKQRH